MNIIGNSSGTVKIFLHHPVISHFYKKVYNLNAEEIWGNAWFYNIPDKDLIVQACTDLGMNYTIFDVKNEYYITNRNGKKEKIIFDEMKSDWDSFEAEAENDDMVEILFKIC